MLAIFGPTAVGKTEVALALADRLRRDGIEPVAISADALQVYKGLDALTCKPSAPDQLRLQHRLISIVSIDQPFNAFLYAQAAHREIDSAIGAGRLPIVVGGTGLYLRAALAELTMSPSEDRDNSQLWAPDTRHPTLLIGLTMDRQMLYERIDERVGRILASNARDEVRQAVAAGASRTARKALGFNELAIEQSNKVVAKLMSKESRNYAKRQLTWMRKMADLHLIDRSGQSADAVADQIVDLITSAERSI